MSASSETDSACMREAIALARMGWGLTNPNPMVGAILVRDGEIIGRGFHRKAGEAHAEVNAFRDAERSGLDPRGSTLYVTLEPCSTYGRTPPCTEKIIASGVKRVVIGALDPNPKHNGCAVQLLRDAGLEVVSGVERGECCELNECFFKWISTRRPFVLLKMAMTLDGKIATEQGESKWITSPEARRRVQKLRRMSDAVMVGANTVRQDHPQLTVRDPEEWEKQPLRIIATNSMDDDELREYFPDGRFEAVSLPDEEAWQQAMQRWGEREIMALLIEGGGELANAALRAGVVDKVEFHIAPKLLGGASSRPVLGGPSPETMSDALNLHRIKIESCGPDIIVSGYFKE